ncbi:hypothetical protein ACFLZV_00975 [Candidatus Margulisiibacteriota bacterium]
MTITKSIKSFKKFLGFNLLDDIQIPPDFFLINPGNLFSIWGRQTDPSQEPPHKRKQQNFDSQETEDHFSGFSENTVFEHKQKKRKLTSIPTKIIPPKDTFQRLFRKKYDIPNNQKERIFSLRDFTLSQKCFDPFHINIEERAFKLFLEYQSSDITKSIPYLPKFIKDITYNSPLDSKKKLQVFSNMEIILFQFKNPFLKRRLLKFICAYKNTTDLAKALSGDLQPWFDNDKQDDWFLSVEQLRNNYLGLLKQIFPTGNNENDFDTTQRDLRDNFNSLFDNLKNKSGQLGFNASSTTGIRDTLELFIVLLNKSDKEKCQNLIASIKKQLIVCANGLIEAVGMILFEAGDGNQYKYNFSDIPKVILDVKQKKMFDIAQKITPRNNQGLFPHYFKKVKEILMFYGIGLTESSIPNNYNDEFAIDLDYASLHIYFKFMRKLPTEIFKSIQDYFNGLFVNDDTREIIIKELKEKEYISQGFIFNRQTHIDQYLVYKATGKKVSDEEYDENMNNLSFYDKTKYITNPTEEISNIIHWGLQCELLEKNYCKFEYEAYICNINKRNISPKGKADIAVFNDALNNNQFDLINNMFSQNKILFLMIRINLKPIRLFRIIENSSGNAKIVVFSLLKERIRLTKKDTFKKKNLRNNVFNKIITEFQKPFFSQELKEVIIHCLYYFFKIDNLKYLKDKELGRYIAEEKNKNILTQIIEVANTGSSFGKKWALQFLQLFSQRGTNKKNLTNIPGFLQSLVYNLASSDLFIQRLCAIVLGQIANHPHAAAKNKLRKMTDLMPNLEKMVLQSSYKTKRIAIAVIAKIIKPVNKQFIPIPEHIVKEKEANSSDNKQPKKIKHYPIIDETLKLVASNSMNNKECGFKLIEVLVTHFPEKIVPLIENNHQLLRHFDAICLPNKIKERIDFIKSFYGCFARHKSLKKLLLDHHSFSNLPEVPGLPIDLNHFNNVRQKFIDLYHFLFKVSIFTNMMQKCHYYFEQDDANFFLNINNNLNSLFEIIKFYIKYNSFVEKQVIAAKNTLRPFSAIPVLASIMNNLSVSTVFQNYCIKNQAALQLITSDIFCSNLVAMSCNNRILKNATNITGPELINIIADYVGKVLSTLLFSELNESKTDFENLALIESYLEHYINFVFKSTVNKHNESVIFLFVKLICLDSQHSHNLGLFKGFLDKFVESNHFNQMTAEQRKNTHSTKELIEISLEKALEKRQRPV